MLTKSVGGGTLVFDMERRRREDYPEFTTEDRPWLDRPDALEAIERRLADGDFDETRAEWLRRWVRDGYVTFEGLLPDDVIDRVNAEVDAIYETNQHLPIGRLKDKFVDVFERSEVTKSCMVRPDVLEHLDLLLGRRVCPFQTLNFPFSSQLGVHSDEIHMSTSPPGFTLAIWFALEDIQPESGPLVVFPGSHRLPFVSSRELGIPKGASKEECGRIFDERYYDRMMTLVQKEGLDYRTYLPKKGDALAWHSNLLHGAKPVNQQGATRRSMVIHYFGEGTEFYSDLWQEPWVTPEIPRP